MARLPFKQVDVFTDRPFAGNPLAVVLGGQALSVERMQQIAAWTNLSETAFGQPSDAADYRVRIFTPRSELPFAGHPTIGSAHAAIEAGIATPADGALTQQCGAGIIPLRLHDDGRISARVPAPHLRRDAAVDVAAVARALGAALDESAAPIPIDVGPVWLVARIATVAELVETTPDLAAVDALSGALGLAGITAFAIDPDPAAEARLVVRSFAPAEGVPEDPVCGSGNAAVGAYLGATGLLAQTGSSYVAAQGAALGRDGRVHTVVRGPEHVEIGSHAITVVDGTMRVE